MGCLTWSSGAYWYENPGPKGGEWKRHQYREVGIVNEYVADCGEWTVDVNHDGLPDVVTAGWQRNGVWWFQNPGKVGVEWKSHFIGEQLRHGRRHRWPTSTATASPT